MKNEYWATPIWSWPVDGIDPRDIVAEVQATRYQDAGRQISNAGGYQSTARPPSRAFEQTQHLLMAIEQLAASACQEWGMSRQGRVVSYWVNINGVKDYNTVHSHPGSQLSGVYYAQAEPGSGDLLFHRNSLADYITGTFGGFTNRYNQSVIRHQCSPGTMVLFPSELAHSVEANLSGLDRISVAFNIT
jgi:uncharacterized protein (TIGR02466 family)